MAAASSGFVFEDEVRAYDCGEFDRVVGLVVDGCDLEGAADGGEFF